MLANAIRENQDNDYDEEKINDIVNQLDRAKNGKINFSEFMSACIDLDLFLTEERIGALFSAVDVDQSGKITR